MSLLEASQTCLLLMKRLVTQEGENVNDELEEIRQI
jgi:hypothetical protein